MKQMTFTDIEYGARRRTTKREEFLEMMEELVPWEEWVSLVKPVYFEGKRGRKPRGIETMLRMYFLQIWFNLSDEAVEDAIYDSYAMRTFMKIDFTNEQAPDATTLCKFRHKLEKSGLGKTFFDAQVQFFTENGYIMRGGSIVDATIVSAPPSTKNKVGERDPEMHQTKKGNQWFFGCKFHHGVDAGSGLIHSVTATAANIHDLDEALNLIRDDDEVVYGDSGYRGIENRWLERKDAALPEFRINKMRGGLRNLSPFARVFEMEIENRKSATRCKVEHTFHIIKNQFGFTKVRYRGISKNLNRWYLAAAFANLVMLGRAGRRIAPLGT